jgi:hypothetical protein
LIEEKFVGASGVKRTVIQRGMLSMRDAFEGLLRDVALNKAAGIPIKG